MNKEDLQKQQLKKARAFLVRTLEQPQNEFQRAAAIQAFEICFELCWKHLKTMVEEDGSLPASPKNTIREAARHGFIDNPEQWFAFLENRNLSVHTYNEDLAAKIYTSIKNDFLPAATKLLQTASPQRDF